jgi:Transport protein Avl9
LQQLDILADYGTKSYIVGSTNSLLLQQKDRYSDILINLDETTINITSSSLRSALILSVADRRWIDFLTQSVNDTWDASNPGRPSTMGYVGSEEFIRLQFEEYLLSLISSVKCHNYLKHHAHNPRAMLPEVEGDPAMDFGHDWIEAWTKSENCRIWERNTDSHLFDIVPPKHPCAGGLTIDDVQRRIAEQVKEFHLDERFNVGKEILGKNLAAGKEKASTVFNKIYADMEAYKENQRLKHEAAKREAEKNGSPLPSPAFASPDFNGAKRTAQSVGSKAGAYLGSWGTWMGEKKAGWGAAKPKNNHKENYPTPPSSTRNEKSTDSTRSFTKDDNRPRTQESYEESLFDADAVEANGGAPGVKEILSSTKEQSPPHPTRFIEEMDSPMRKPSPLEMEKVKPVVKSNGVPDTIAPPESRHLSEDSLSPGKDDHNRFGTVAKAVEDATATPISP